MRHKPAEVWPLWSILAIQAVCTLPWLWRTAPFTDEALYLSAGHQEWSHWLHHVPVPNYAASFSGAPVLYPPLAAAADTVGGVVLARGLSLALMAAVTCLVYLIGTRMFGRHTGYYAAALFAVTGLVIHYGAFATFDAFALFFLTCATWAAVRVGEGRFLWIAGVVASLAVANAAKYATLPFDLVPVGVIVLHGWATRHRPIVPVLQGLLLAAAMAALDVGLLALGGESYMHGVAVTTVFRSIHWQAPSSAASVAWRAFALTGVLVVPGVLSVAVSVVRRNPLPVTGLLVLFVAAALIVPVDQARIHQITSLDKNLGFGLPFAALAAGYAVSAGIEWLIQAHGLNPLAGYAGAFALVLLALVAGREQSVQFRGASAHAAAAIVTAISRGYRPGTYILSNNTMRMEQYYLPGIPAPSWTLLRGSPTAQLSRFRPRICGGLVSLVVLRVPSSLVGRQGNPASPLLSASPLRLAITVSQGRYTTQVWRLATRPREATCR